jgi:hypothetical protein
LRRFIADLSLAARVLRDGRRGMDLGRGGEATIERRE